MSDEWRRPPVGQVPHEAGPDDDTPPRGMLRVLGVRLPPPPRLPTGVQPPPRRQTKPGMPAPPHNPPAYMHVHEHDPDDEITEPASPAYRLRRLVVDFSELSEDEKQRAERYIQAMLRARKKKG